MYLILKNLHSERKDRQNQINDRVNTAALTAKKKIKCVQKQINQLVMPPNGERRYKDAQDYLK